MSEPRFTVKWNRGGNVEPGPPGWVVCDRGHRITKTFATYAEAELRRDNIAALYLRFGW